MIPPTAAQLYGKGKGKLLAAVKQRENREIIYLRTFLLGFCIFCSFIQKIYFNDGVDLQIEFYL